MTAMTASPRSADTTDTPSGSPKPWYRGSKSKTTTDTDTTDSDTPSGSPKPWYRSKSKTTSADTDSSKNTGLRSTLVQAGSTPSDEVLELTHWDTALSRLNIDAAWLFNEVLDAAALRESLSELLRLYPMLSGRIARSTTREHMLAVELCDAGVPFIESVAEEGPADKSATEGFTHFLAPKDTVKNRGALMSVKLTTFKDGSGSALGVCINHGLVDGTSFFGVIQTWAKGHSSGAWDTQTKGTTSRSWELDLPDEPEPSWFLSKEAFRRNWVCRNVVDPALTHMMSLGVQAPRAVVHFSDSEVEALRATIPGATRSEALMVALYQGIAPHIKKSRVLGAKSWKMLIQANMRGRGAPTDLVGNSVHVMGVGLPEFPDKMKRSEVHRHLKAKIDEEVRGPESSKNFLRLTRLQEQGFEHNSTNTTNPLEFDPRYFFLFNSQLHSAVNDIQFGTARCSGYIPQHVGDTVRILPAIGGGINVYICLHRGRKGWLEAVQSEAFKAAIL